MTKRRRGRKPKHVTAHRRALANSDTRQLVSYLRKRWKKMGRIERGERLRELVVLGCSTRGLEAALGHSATTVRRHVQIANLPAKERAAVNAGASAKKILAKKAAVDRQRRKQERVNADQRTGALSDEIADIVLEFCRAKEGLPEKPISSTQVEKFLSSARSYLCRFELTGQRANKVPKRFGVLGLLTRTRPAIYENDFWFERQAQCLATAVLSRAPERPIWERGLQKAKRRAGELKKEDAGPGSRRKARTLSLHFHSTRLEALLSEELTPVRDSVTLWTG